MKITSRRYSLLRDYERVFRFLQASYDRETLNSYLLPHYWEYAHHHSHFDAAMTHRTGLWERGGELCAVAAYEMKLGEVHLHALPDCAFLLPEMLDWSERELSLDGKLSVWITDKEQQKRELLQSRGYALECEFPVTIYDYRNKLGAYTLPDGFSFVPTEELDAYKISECYWYGFNHEGDVPDDQVDFIFREMGAPHGDITLTVAVAAPNGEYACALGMWYDEVNRYAYLEPLATMPQYRRKGLAAAALTESMRRTQRLGATYCFGGLYDFYFALGFEAICNRELWGKRLG